MLVAFGGSLSAATLPVADPSAPVPFLRLREAALEYHGPEGDFPDLTEIRIGWFGPTNLNDPLTGDLWWAASLALEQANARAGYRSHNASPLTDQPPPFRLVPRWAVDPWGTGVSQFTRMVYEEQPLAVIGSIDSPSTHLAEQVVAKANLPLVSPIATDPSITLAGVPWVFSCAPSDGAIARALVDDLLATLSTPQSDLSELPSPISELPQPERSGLALLTTTDHESRMTTRAVLRELSRRRRPPDYRFEAPPGVPNFARQLAALREARASVLLIIAGAEDSAQLVRAVRGYTSGTPASLPAKATGAGENNAEAGGTGPVLFGGATMGRRRFQELAGPAAEGVRFPLLATVVPGDAAATRFIDEFTSVRRHPPDYTAMLAYDATCLLLETIGQVGPHRARIRAALAGLPPWQGIAGVIRFDGTGQNTRADLPMATLRAGRIERVGPGISPAVVRAGESLTGIRN